MSDGEVQQGDHHMYNILSNLLTSVVFVNTLSFCFLLLHDICIHRIFNQDFLL